MAFQQTTNYIPTDVGGGCYFCGAAQRDIIMVEGGNRPELLFRWDGAIEYEGSVVICETCVSDLARACGWSTPEDNALRAAALAALQTAFDDATDKRLAAEGLLEAFRVFDETNPVTQLPVPDTAGERISAVELAEDDAPVKRGPGRPRKVTA